MKSAKYCNSWLAIHGFWCTAYWMCSMYRYQCCHYSVFFNVVFFCTLHFCLDVISQNYYVIKFRIYHLLCVLLWWWWNCNFFLILTFLVFHILYKRWELIKKEKEKKVEIIQSHPFSKNRFDNGPHIEDFWSTLSLWKKKIRWTRIMTFVDDSNSCAMCHMHSIIVCVCECVTLTCVRQDL